ncbi:MAG: phage virion morphogenesis protein [Prevotella sp.]|nr:phage virion morphogenesis protein [Prevotella sp.]
MDLKQFQQQLARQQREIDDARRRKLPVKVGRIAADHFKENFRKGGFVNGGLHPWQPTKRQQSGSKRAAAKYDPLLSRRKHLYGGLKYIPGDYRVLVRDDLKYAPIHNWGGDVSPTVTEKMRKYAWARYNEAIGRKKGVKRKKKYVESEEALRWKALALTKKPRLQINIPQRQFLGESQELNQKINETIDKEISKIIDNG